MERHMCSHTHGSFRVVLCREQGNGETCTHRIHNNTQICTQTELATAYLTENIKRSLDHGNVIGAVFLDLKKAFDTVNHEMLLHKLNKLNFSQTAINWFRSYLEHREQCVRVNGSKSSFQNCTMGVPQGSILGPLLFCLYINDLPDGCKGVQCQMYTADAVIYVTAKTSKQAAELLNTQMVGVSRWFNNNFLTLNHIKTVSICFTIRCKICNNFIIVIDHREIQKVDEFKYLAVVLDSHLKFESHIRKVSRTIKTNLNCFRLIRPYLSVKAAQLYLHAMILSHLSYCVIVWSQATQSALRPVKCHYKQALKVLDQKPIKWHHCKIQEKYDLLSFNNFKNYFFL
uniref:Reverse transcriptase domain-containing protein n=1 Tax=Paramormyrops kingsleyae TaxID=1676925 RepID=A0A3B3RJN3_9TELE